MTDYLAGLDARGARHLRDDPARKDPMADTTLLYTAVCDDKSAALSDIDALERLHHDEMLGDYDAAVVDKEEAYGGRRPRPRSGDARCGLRDRVETASTSGGLYGFPPCFRLLASM
jgi:hypothetical protein